MKIFRRLLRCSFCGRDESQVAKLVAGPRVYICDRCAQIAVRIMETAPPADSPADARFPVRSRLFRGWKLSPRELRTAERA